MRGTLTLTNDLRELSRLYNLVNRLGGAASLTRSEIYTLNLVLEEIVTNVMKYAYGQGVEKPIIIRYQYDKRCLNVEVEDQGPAFNPLEAGEPDLSSSLENRQIGGLGIHLVKHLASNLVYSRKNDKNILRLVMETDPDRDTNEECGAT